VYVHETVNEDPCGTQVTVVITRMKDFYTKFKALKEDAAEISASKKKTRKHNYMISRVFRRQIRILESTKCKSKD